MNWLEIDKILYSIIARHDAVEDMLKEAKIQFKWTDRQAETALLPLLTRKQTIDSYLIMCYSNVTTYLGEYYVNAFSWSLYDHNKV